MTNTERGVATIWAAGAVVAILGVVVFVLYLYAAVIARHRAESAADLAALAAAAKAVSGTQAACSVASQVAQRNGAHIMTCSLDGWKALVEVRVELAASWKAFGVATALSVAGPVER